MPGWMHAITTPPSWRPPATPWKATLYTKPNTALAGNATRHHGPASAQSSRDLISPTSMNNASHPCCNKEGAETATDVLRQRHRTTPRARCTWARPGRCVLLGEAVQQLFRHSAAPTGCTDWSARAAAAACVHPRALTLRACMRTTVAPQPACCSGTGTASARTPVRPLADP